PAISRRNSSKPLCTSPRRPFNSRFISSDIVLPQNFAPPGPKDPTSLRFPPRKSSASCLLSERGLHSRDEPADSRKNQSGPVPAGHRGPHHRDHRPLAAKAAG